MNVTAEDLRDWPSTRKVRLIHDLWQQLVDEKHEPNLDPSLIDEIQRRGDELENDPSQGMSEAEVWRTVDAG